MAAQGLLLICALGDIKAQQVMSAIVGDELYGRFKSLFPQDEVLTLKNLGIARRGFLAMDRGPGIIGDPPVTILYLFKGVTAWEALNALNFEDGQTVFVASAVPSQIEEVRRRGIDDSAGYVIFDGKGVRAPTVDFSRSVLITRGDDWNSLRGRSVATVLMRTFVFADEVARREAAALASGPISLKDTRECPAYAG